MLWHLQNNVTIFYCSLPYYLHGYVPDPSQHPQLPLQGALGFSKSFQQLIHHNQIDIGSFGKGKSRALASGSSNVSIRVKINFRANAMVDPLAKPILAENMMTTMTQAQPPPTTRTPTGTSHPTPITTDSRHRHQHGPETPLCAPPAAAYLGQINNAIPVIKLHYLTPSSRRSTFQSMTVAGVVIASDTWLALVACLGPLGRA